MASTRNLNDAIKKVKLVIEQITKLKASFTAASFKQSTGTLYQLAMPVLPDKEFLMNSGNPEAIALATQLQQLMMSSLDTVQETRNAHAQPEGINLKSELIKQAKINDAAKLLRFIRDNEYGLVRLGGVDALSHALRNAAAAGCHHNIPVLIMQGANSLNAGKDSGSLPIHHALSNLHPLCVKALLECFDTEGGWYCDIKQLLAQKDNKDALELLMTKEFTRLTKGEQKRYKEILTLINEHLISPKQSQINPSEAKKRLALLDRVKTRIVVCEQPIQEVLEVKSVDANVKILNEPNNPEFKNSPPPLPLLSVVQYRYNAEEKQEIIAKLTALTKQNQWKLANHFDGSLIVRLSLADKTLATHMAIAINKTEAMEASMIEHTENELKKDPGKQPYTLNLSKIRLSKLRELKAIEGIDLRNENQPGAPIFHL